jgi:hypothetical protein
MFIAWYGQIKTGGERRAKGEDAHHNDLLLRRMRIATSRLQTALT